MKHASKDPNKVLQHRQNVRIELVRHYQRAKERWQKAGCRKEHLIAEIEAADTSERIFKEDFREIDNQLAKFDQETDCIRSEALMDASAANKTIH